MFAFEIEIAKREQLNLRFEYHTKLYLFRKERNSFSINTLKRVLV